MKGNTISINHTKGIEHLTFPVPSRPGVYLHVAPNGSGKTTVLTTLHRICEGNAFFLGFRTASENAEIDQYADAAITYTSSEGNSVTFRKRESRWVSTPKSNADVLSSFGFKSASFIKADPKRLSPSQEEIRTGSYVPAPTEIKQAMNRLIAVLDNDVFDENEPGYAGKQRQLAAYENRVFNLGVTPEQAVIEALEQRPAQLMNQLREHFHIKFDSLAVTPAYLQVNTTKPRVAAKQKLGIICREIQQIFHMPEKVIYDKLITLTLPYIYTDEQVIQHITPIVKAIMKPAR